MPRSASSFAVFGTESGSDTPQSQAEFDDQPFRPVGADDLEHALGGHLRVRIDGEGGEEAPVLHLFHRLLVDVIDHHARRVEAMLQDHVHGARGAALLVAMRRVDHHRQIELAGKVELEAEMDILPGFATKEDVVAIGEIGYDVVLRWRINISASSSTLPASSICR